MNFLLGCPLPPRAPHYTLVVGRKRQQSKETVEGEQKSNQAKLDERLGIFLIWCEDLWCVVAAAGALSRFIVFVVSGSLNWVQTSLQVQPWYFWESKWLLFRPIFLGLPKKIRNYKRESRWEPFRIKPSTPSLSWNHGENSMSWNQSNMCFQKGGTFGLIAFGPCLLLPRVDISSIQVHWGNEIGFSHLEPAVRVITRGDQPWFRDRVWRWTSSRCCKMDQQVATDFWNMEPNH